MTNEILKTGRKMGSGKFPKKLPDVRIEEETASELKKTAEQEKMRISTFVRNAIKFYINLKKIENGNS